MSAFSSDCLAAKKLVNVAVARDDAVQQTNSAIALESFRAAQFSLAPPALLECTVRSPTFDTLCKTTINESTGIRSMATYFSMRNMVISRLKHDIEAQESGRFSEIGIHFDTISDEFDLLPHVVDRGSPEWDRLNAAMAFWSAWIGARFDGWRNSHGVAAQEWPRLARRLVEDLASDREVSDPAIRRYFHYSDGITAEEEP